MLFIKFVSFRGFFSNVTAVSVYKIGLLILEDLLLDQLVKHLKGHYYRSAHLHREGFDAFDQRRAENITNKFELIHPHFLNNLSGLR